MNDVVIVPADEPGVKLRAEADSQSDSQEDDESGSHEIGDYRADAGADAVQQNKQKGDFSCNFNVWIDDYAINALMNLGSLTKEKGKSIVDKFRFIFMFTIIIMHKACACRL